MEIQIILKVTDDLSSLESVTVKNERDTVHYQPDIIMVSVKDLVDDFIKSTSYIETVEEML